ncbi:MAG: YdcF family protein [Pseudomonadota bacterium]|nr:YdcF family protein [Pseudomonadota bacterium]
MTNFKKLIIFFLTIGFISFSWWLILLFNIFPKSFYLPTNYKLGDETAIIVLTGGKGRIEKGTELFDNGLGKYLFISGVFKKSELEIRDEIINQIEKRECCIIYDENARNTFENAHEVKRWLERKNNLNNLILVTSYYHLPRSYIIFKNAIPDRNISLFPAEFNIRFDKEFFFHARLIISEYFKVIYTILSLLWP